MREYTECVDSGAPGEYVSDACVHRCLENTPACERYVARYWLL